MAARLSVKEIQARRDAEWTEKVLGLTGKVLTPEQGAKWLEMDRIQLARNVADATRPKGRPQRY